MTDGTEREAEAGSHPLVPTWVRGNTNLFAMLVAGVVVGLGLFLISWLSPVLAPLGLGLFLAALAAPPGVYHLRMSATDASGRGGAADTEVDARLTEAGGLKLSSIVLGLSRNNGFVPKLQFGGEAVAIGQFEIYGRVSGQISALLEIAQTLNGPALTSMPLAISATEEPDRFLVRGALPIGALPTGDYVVRGIVEVPGHPAGRVVRTLRKISM